MPRANAINDAIRQAAPNNPAVAKLGTILKQLHDAILYQAFSSAGLAIGSASKAKVLIANTVTYSNNGVAKSKTTAEVAFTATTHDLSDGYKARYLLALAADGTPSITKGNSVLAAGTAVTPKTPDGETAIGYVELTADGDDFDATTDDLDAAHITDTYVNLFTNPSDVEIA